MSGHTDPSAPSRREPRPGRRARVLGGALAALIGTLIPVSEPIAADAAVAGPSATWVTTDKTVAGLVYLRASAAANPSDSTRIKKWCLVQDGLPVTTDLAKDTYSNVDNYGVFNSTTGCWSSDSVSLTSGVFGINTTAWPDASHTYQLTVTDTSDRTATSTVLTITTSNPGPSATWVTTDKTVAGLVYIRASAAPDPSGTARIKKWCLVQDGLPVTTDLAKDTYSNVDNYGVFNSTTGCWSSDSVSLTSGVFGINTTAWPDASHTYQLTVTDTSDRTATSTVLTITTSNPGPSATWVTTDKTVAGLVYIRASAAPDPSGTARIKKWCLVQDGLPVTTDLAKDTYSNVDNYGVFNSTTGCWSSDSVSLTSGVFGINTTAWPDASHTYQLTVTDTSDRTATSTVLTITTSNPGPSATWVPADRLAVRRAVVVRATAAPDPSGTARIKQWCFALDGVPIAQRWSTSVSGYSDLASYGTTFVPATGCYVADARSGALRVDTTAWTDGEHTLRLTVTDTSGRERVTDLTMTSTNPTYSLEMTGIADGAAIKRVVEIRTWITRAAEQSDIAIARYCFYFDDRPCIEFISTETDKDWRWESAQIDDGAHTLRVTVEDSYGRIATSRTVRFTVANPRPTLRFTWPSSTKATRQTLSLSASAAFVADQFDLGAEFCVRIDEGECEAGSFKTRSAKWKVNTTKLSNGTHTMQFVVTDSTGRTTALPPRTFTVSNRMPTGSRPAGKFRLPRKYEPWASIRITTRTANASTLTVQYGRTPDALDGVEEFDVASGGSTSSGVSISGLEFDRQYYFRVTASSALGTAKTYTFSKRSPREARIVRTRCRNVKIWFIWPLYWPGYEIREYWSSGEVDVDGPNRGSC